MIMSNTDIREGRLAVVSRNLDEAAKSNLVWRKMLPPNYEWVAKGAVEGPIRYESLKELYERFSKHILVGEGLEGYGCDPKTGDLYWTFAASTLSIIWGSDSRYWRWLPGTAVHGSRFAKVANLVQVCWLDLKGEIQTRLRPGTYSLRWVLQFDDDDMFYGRTEDWYASPVTFTFTRGGDVQSSCIEFPRFRSHGDVYERVHWTNGSWFEYEAGRFTVEKGDTPQLEITQEVKLKFDMKETGNTWKSGLSVDGVIIRQHSSTLDETEPEFRPGPVPSEA